MKGRPIVWSAAELAWIEARRETPRAALHAAFVAAFGRDDVSRYALTGLCWRKGWRTGRSGCFQPGLTPANKGKRMGLRPGCVATQFRRGNVPHNTRFAGHERLSKNGYIEISVFRPARSGFERSYVLKHRYLWEERNGPLPKGMALKCLDSNRRNTDPDNWVAVPRASLPRLAGGKGRRLPYDSAAPEVRPAILAVARLAHAVGQARKAAKGARHDA